MRVCRFSPPREEDSLHTCESDNALCEGCVAAKKVQCQHQHSHSTVTLSTVTQSLPLPICSLDPLQSPVGFPLDTRNGLDSVEQVGLLDMILDVTFEEETVHLCEDDRAEWQSGT